MTDQEIFEKWAKKWTKDIQGSLRRNRREATGKTIKSVKYKVLPSGFEITGAKHIDNIILGRGKSKRSGGGGWLDQLKEWAVARGIPQGAVYAIYKSINAKGWSTPPSPTLLTDVITDSEISLLLKDLAKNQLSLMKDVLQKSINK